MLETEEDSFEIMQQDSIFSARRRISKASNKHMQDEASPAYRSMNCRSVIDVRRNNIFKRGVVVLSTENLMSHRNMPTARRSTIENLKGHHILKHSYNTASARFKDPTKMKHSLSHKTMEVNREELKAMEVLHSINAPGYLYDDS